MISGSLVPHLFIRISQKIKSVTQPFIYCGRMRYKEYEKGTSKPVHIVFQNIDYDDFNENDDLIEVYKWNPEKAGKPSKSIITKKGKVSRQRKNNYKKPNETERKGLVTSRVGQGYYRNQIIEKWNGQCPISGVSIRSLLIASHIVPWSESNDEERLDVNNGILLSPTFDALFDRHLISFDDKGSILISKLISEDQKVALGLRESISIPVDKGMAPYLKRHNEIFKNS